MNNIDDDGSSGEVFGEKGSGKRKGAGKILLKTKQKAKNVLHIKETPHSDLPKDPEDNVVDSMATDPAFNPSLVLDEGTKHEKPDSATVKSALKSLSIAVAHPRAAIEHKATRSAAAEISKSHPTFNTADQDKPLLDAYDELEASRSKTSPTRSDSLRAGEEEDDDIAANLEEQDAARDKIEELEDRRTGTHIAWILGRHVDRVIAVRADAQVPKPERDDFLEESVEGEPAKFQWGPWLGAQALYQTRGFTTRYIDDTDEPPFDLKDLSRIVERLALVSAPWQAWFMSVRQVYLWEDPMRTGKWLAVYSLLWYTEHIASFLFAFIIYSVLSNRISSTAVQSVRDSMKRSTESESRAQAWGEMVERYGHRDWIEPAMEEMGPQVQMYLSDITDFLEILVHFYRWEAPWKTAETLFFFSCCLLVTLYADTAFCLRFIWFLVGGWFFVCLPLSTHHPKYRHLLDPLKWMFWDIPTTAEWSIKVLQRKVENDHLNKVLKIRKEGGGYSDFSLDGYSSSPEFEMPTSSPSTDLGFENGHAMGPRVSSYRAFQRANRGRFNISVQGLSFASSERNWSFSYHQVIEMVKVEGTPKLKGISLGFLGSSLHLVFKGPDGELNETLIVGRDKRDEIFNRVLAWSGLKWRTAWKLKDESKPAAKKSKILDAVIG